MGPDGAIPTFSWALKLFRERNFEKKPSHHVLVRFGVRLWSPKPVNPHVPVRLAVKRRLGERGDCQGFRRFHPDPHVPMEAGATESDENMEPTPRMASPEAPSRGPSRGENMGIAHPSRTGPLQISSFKHLRIGKTRFRTGASQKATPGHRPKANTNASSN